MNQLVLAKSKKSPDKVRGIGGVGGTFKTELMEIEENISPIVRSKQMKDVMK